MTESELKGALEYVPVSAALARPTGRGAWRERPSRAPQERLYYVAIRGTPPASMCSRAHFFTIANALVYWK